MADEVKQVKVDNWGIYFLQRLKHFFNRTDYCDLTLQFQDNAQLKVHRLVLSACTEYFELLERTCEMYEDCLVMPEDLQADIVVPIVNFMYTGQLEFKMDVLERLYQCSEIMNMPVLTKLLDSHRPKPKVYNTQSYPPVKKVIKRMDGAKELIKSISATEIVTTTPITYKRSHNNAFAEKTTVYRDKKIYLPINKPTVTKNGSRTYRDPSPIPLDQSFNKKIIMGDPRPTRYELPEEFDGDNIFENSFCNISYASQPLMVHPETRKQYAKRPKLAGEASTSKKFGATTVDIVPKKQIKIQEDSLFEDTVIPDDSDMFTEQFTNNKPGSSKDTNQLFDQILDKPEDTKVTIETKNAKAAGNLDHAKIISEVLKKYPHLVKSNKNIKLKILNTPSKAVKKQKPIPLPKPIKIEKEVDFTYETDVIDSIQAAKLIALGADNVDGPWICLICGTPGKAMNFTSYYKFRRHLVEVHNEKPVLNICEYCGQKSTKRNYLLHHMYTKHGVEPPPQYRFPKCNHCSYIALTEALLVKHKLSHSEVKKFRCNVCPAAFHSSSQLLSHIQNTGHKYTTERKSNFQCIYCQKVFLRETNLCAHLKLHHKSDSIHDGIIDDSDDEIHDVKRNIVKAEPVANDFQELDIQYQIQQRPDGNINVVTKTVPEPSTSTKQTILNAGFSQILPDKPKTPKKLPTTQNEYMPDINMSTSNDTLEEIVMIDNTEYIMRDNQLIPRRPKQISNEYVLSDQGLQPTTSMEFTNVHDSNQSVQENIQHANMLLKNPENLGQSIPIYVSNEEEYKALMASNQPIIFDSGDSNKTLTVLTAPHTSSLDTTTIDLGTTQANDMMILQDNYPLNVSEAVASENSNIVVVYSHPVDGQNKQYQLLTTQGLGAQFVQSSAIITQNFETVTTTAPILNTQNLEKQVQEVWHSNLDQIVNTDHIEITAVPARRSIQEQGLSKPLQTDTVMNELPMVELSSNIAAAAENNICMTSANQSQEDMVVEDATMTNTLDKSSEVVCEEVPTQHAEDETVDSNDHAVNPNENLSEPVGIDPKTATIVEDAVLIESQTFTQPENLQLQTYTQTELNIEPAVEAMNETNEQQQSEELVNDIQTTRESETIQENNEEQFLPTPDGSKTKKIEQILADESTEKTETLSPDWAIGSIQEIQEESQTALGSQDEDEPHLIYEQDPLEESIENIQQEVDKQLASKTIITEPDMTDDISDVANSSQDESDYVQVAPVPVVIDPVVAQEKISSLLNDWEDNDSQDNDSQDNDTQDNDTQDNDTNDIAPEKVEETVENTAISKIDTPEKHDKIKSLVSDWDEDEDEMKV